MAHPYDSSRADKIGKSRASSFTKGYAAGGVADTGNRGVADLVSDKDAAQQARENAAARTSRSVLKTQSMNSEITGRATGGRLDKFARGGKTKNKKQGNNVNIAIVQPSGEKSASGSPIGAGPLPPPGGPPKPPMMPPPPPPGPPMGGPPGMPPKPPGMMNRGGKVKGQKGGDNGVGRLDKAKMYGLKPKKGG